MNNLTKNFLRVALLAIAVLGLFSEPTAEGEKWGEDFALSKSIGVGAVLGLVALEGGFTLSRKGGAV